MGRLGGFRIFFPGVCLRGVCSFSSQELDELLSGHPRLVDYGEQGPPLDGSVAGDGQPVLAVCQVYVASFLVDYPEPDPAQDLYHPAPGW